ncbi:MAG: TetR/AcrR family transcriptional regulator [bacterium]
MKRSLRKTSDERRQAIIEAIKGVFAEKGFEKTTTRELAKIAGVSEALLYKHFPSKESMYIAIHEDLFKNSNIDEFERVMEMKPSTSTLVVLVHSFISRLVKVQSEEESEFNWAHLLLTRSLLEDGDFARIALKQFPDRWIAKFEACVKEAAKAEDLKKIPVNMDVRGWCILHIGINMMLTLYPKVPAVDYKISREMLVEQAVWFALLGTGLKEEAIKRYYNPDALAELMG